MGVLDWINFGLGVANAANSISNARKLEQMQQQGAAQAILESIITELRNIVFDSRERLRALEPHIATDPMPVYALALTVGHRFQALEISPRIFPEFKDKEFVQATLAQLDQLYQATKSKLSAEQIAQAEKCASALTQMPLLEKAIETQIAQEELQKAQAEWNSLSNRRSSFRLGGCLSLLAIVPICSVGFLCSLSAIGNPNNNPNILGSLMMISFLILAFGCFVGGMVLFANSSSNRYSELEKQREDLKKKVADNETQQTIVNVFGRANSDGYKEMLNRHRELIQATLSSMADNPLLS